MPRPSTRHDKYNWLLTADPPICAQGRPVAVLNQCERRRRGGECWCRFDAAEIGQDLRDLNDPPSVRIAGEFEDELEPEDVEILIEQLAAVIRRTRPASAFADDRLERLKHVQGRLERVAKAGAGLTARYGDEIDG